MTALWEPATAGVLRLPSARLVRGRGLSRPLPPGPQPAFALYLLGRRPRPLAWENRWLHWPDFWLPSDRTATTDALREAWTRAEAERVEIACAGGHGRTERPWPASPYSMGYPTGRRSPMSASITLHVPSRHRGNAASSPASSSRP